MKKLILLTFPIFLFANSIFVDDNIANENINGNITNNIVDTTIDFKSVQKQWLKSKTSSVKNIKFMPNKTYRIQTRVLMNTMIIFNEDKVASKPIYGNKGFMIKKLGVGKYDFSNIISIQPKLVGIDTNLTVIGESGNVYSFYLYSTDYKSKTIPNTVVFVSENKSSNKIKVVNIEKEQFVKHSKKIKKDKEKKVIKDPDYFYVGEGKNRIKVYKEQVIDDFVQDGAEELKAKKIFRDNKFVYFKYDKDYSLSSFPAIFKVVDGFDSPINFRIVGDYLVAETIANKFTLRIENKHVCVRRLKEVKHEK